LASAVLLARYRAGRIAGEHPTLVPLIARRRDQDRMGLLTIDRRTELVLEGYPRSGNTFAVGAFRAAQQRPTRVSHHVHAPAQILVATRRQVPTLVLIRRPVDAALSLVAFLPYLSLKGALKGWLSFYERVRPLLRDIVLAEFDEVTADFGAVTVAVNARFETTFGVFVHDEVNTASVYRDLDTWQHRLFPGALFEQRVARPSLERQANVALRREGLSDPAIRRLLAKADALYEELVGQRTVVPYVGHARLPAPKIPPPGAALSIVVDSAAGDGPHDFETIARRQDFGGDARALDRLAVPLDDHDPTGQVE
jgi:hypothetical protein